MKSTFLVCLACVLTATTAPSQAKTTDADKLRSLNNYVHFSNESTHGLLIVHRLLENFNKNINKYVDLPDQQINFYSNKDLPKDIFEDPENWFYDTSPNEWHAKILEESSVLPAPHPEKMNQLATEMKAITDAVNQLRFALEEQIKTLDLTKRENLSLVYDKLEEGVTLYKQFYAKQLLLEKQVQECYKLLAFSADDIQFVPVINAMKGVYTSNRATLNALYYKEDDNFLDLIKQQQAALDELNGLNLASFNSTRLINTRVQMYWGNIKRQGQAAVTSCKAFAESENIPEEYKLYDKYYYYYNIAVIDKFNRYGNGVVIEMNRILDYLSVPVVRFFEMPHYFKVIYPKLLEKVDFLKASDPVISSIPTIVKGRNVVVATRTIKVDSFLVKFNMYDHKVIDKDIVSLSFNGDWIVEKFVISEKPYLFTVRLNEKGKNFLLLHADDMGLQPPATIALSYTYRKKKEVIILNSDTVKSEVIEIIVDP
jgi:hypothetical protein